MHSAQARPARRPRPQGPELGNDLLRLVLVPAILLSSIRLEKLLRGGPLSKRQRRQDTWVDRQN